jgi:hypothetical protein
VALDNDYKAEAEATLVKSVLMAFFDEDVTQNLSRAKALARIESRAKDIDGQRTIGIY